MRPEARPVLAAPRLLSDQGPTRDGDFKVFSWSSTRLGSAKGTQLLATLPIKGGSGSNDAD